MSHVQVKNQANNRHFGSQLWLQMTYAHNYGASSSYIMCNTGYAYYYSGLDSIRSIFSDKSLRSIFSDTSVRSIFSDKSVRSVFSDKSVWSIFSEEWQCQSSLIKAYGRSSLIKAYGRSSLIKARCNRCICNCPTASDSMCGVHDGVYLNFLGTDFQTVAA